MKDTLFQEIVIDFIGIVSAVIYATLSIYFPNSSKENLFKDIMNLQGKIRTYREREIK